jgi:hypothetical protein
VRTVQRWRVIALSLTVSLAFLGLPSARAGTGSPYLVKDIDPGAGDSSPLWLTNVGGTLYFRAGDGPCYSTPTTGRTERGCGWW